MKKFLSIIILMFAASVACGQSYFIKTIIRGDTIEHFTPHNSEVFLLQDEIRVWAETKDRRESSRIKIVVESREQVEGEYLQLVLKNKELGSFIYVQNYKTGMIILKGRLLQRKIVTLILEDTGDF